MNDDSNKMLGINIFENDESDKMWSLTRFCTVTDACDSSTIVDYDIYCYGYASCEGSQIITSGYVNCYGCMACSHASLYDDGWIKCDGYYTCYSSNIGYYGSTNGGGTILIDGSYSAWDSTITASLSTVYCRGKLARRFSRITSNVTHCGGLLSCSYADIIG